MQQNVVQLFAQKLADEHVKRVYLMIGGAITYIADAIHKLNYTKTVCVHHEQAAAFAAEAEGRLSDAPGIAIATSGPGATNLVTGIASCYFDSVPAIFITGQISTADCCRSAGVRQLGFQETSIIDVVKPITKYCVQVKNAEQAVQSLDYAFHIARNGRPGPVLIDLPMDVQLQPGPDHIAAQAFNEGSVPSVLEDDPSLEQLFSLLSEAKRPVVMIGGGVRAARCADQLGQFLERLQLPAVSSLMGLDALPGDHPLRLGFIGMFGNRWANWALAKADFVLVLGSRLSANQTGANIPAFLTGKTLYRVDCDKGELSARVKAQHCVTADLSAFLKAALGATAKQKGLPLSTDNWLAAIRKVQRLSDDVSELKTEGINPNWFMRELSAASPLAAAFVSDVGNNQLWAAQSLRTRAGQRILNSCGLGAMGFALPAAMGAAFATGKPVVSICGDGGCLVNVQELQTIARNRLPVKIVVLNNQVLGLVRLYQDNFLGGRLVASQWGYDAPDFVSLAQAFKIPASSVDSKEAVSKGLADLWRDPQRPYLLEVTIPHDTPVAPNMIFQNTHDAMHPPCELDVCY